MQTIEIKTLAQGRGLNTIIGRARFSLGEKKFELPMIQENVPDSQLIDKTHDMKSLLLTSLVTHIQNIWFTEDQKPVDINIEPFKAVLSGKLDDHGRPKYVRVYPYIYEPSELGVLTSRNAVYDSLPKFGKLETPPTHRVEP